VDGKVIVSAQMEPIDMLASKSALHVPPDRQEHQRQHAPGVVNTAASDDRIINNSEGNRLSGLDLHSSSLSRQSSLASTHVPVQDAVQLLMDNASPQLV
jgi:hypothetical protein